MGRLQYAGACESHQLLALICTRVIQAAAVWAVSCALQGEIQRTRQFGGLEYASVKKADYSLVAIIESYTHKAVPLLVIRLQNLAFDSLIEIMIHGYYSNPGLVATGAWKVE
jgi:hypothetical protein